MLDKIHDQRIPIVLFKRSVLINKKNTKWATGDRVGNKDEWRIETSGIKLSLSPLPPSHPRASGYELCAVYDDVSIKNPPYRACVDSLVFRPKIFYL